ncbi:hypothetical protein GE21DRAFT_9505 [Neurospora crassa]|uniref:Uncharacterized protein n=2 Tax=Neurospora crassa TaxID=5141 RepID=Q1K5N4_NEUCR|nr:hypothetical protein NCU05100 [Neurospora crassa OR74A]EAA27850.1 hypothetical protein NCU05100 [Neurospora crassa OR74A]KHE87971.1 hypothetical protein GE21DRAFT_9505 [Neurospora crassa]CAD70426.1 hypothetical protein [Neurospora crassa]|eukprot:XP_957086.1 hypothetical protein NCU05100 [Neurospora crassa OR74A]
MERMLDTWKISRKLFDEIQKPGSFPNFSFFESGQTLHIGFRWSSTPGSYLIFLGSMFPVNTSRYNALSHPIDQFRGVFSHRGVLTPTWNEDVMKSGENTFGRREGTPLRLPVMMLNQCEKHLESSIQRQAEKVEEIQDLLSYTLGAKYPSSARLHAQHRDLTTSIFTLRNSCRNLMEICSGLVSASEAFNSPKYAADDHLRRLKVLRDGIEKIHARLKFHLNRIHYLENIHIQSTKSMAALKQLMFSN